MERLIYLWRTTPLALLALWLGACATTTSPPTAVEPRLVDPQVVDVEQRALLLLLGDRLIYEPIAVNAALEGGPEIRRQLALTLGRAGDPRGTATLEVLLGDRDLPVRRAAAFALGELGEHLGSEDDGAAQAIRALLVTVNDSDRETGRLAVESLAKLGLSSGAVTTRLIEGSADELFPRLLPSLFRFQRRGAPDLEVVRWAAEGLRLDDPELRSQAAYALARQPLADGAPFLRGLLGDEDPWVRGWAARALGQVGVRSDLELLRPLLDDAEPGPIIEALRSARGLILRGEAAPPWDWQPRLLELLADPRPGIRLTAIEASAGWLLDDELGDALVAFVRSGLQRERELALAALAEGEDPRARGLVAEACRTPQVERRAGCAGAAGLVGARPLLDELFDDSRPRVRLAALETLLAAEVEESRPYVDRALDDDDMALRARGLAWAEEHPHVEMERLLETLGRSRRDRQPDARLAAVRALGARALAEPLERGAIVAELEDLTRVPEYLVRLEAARALASLDRPAPDVGGWGEEKPVRIYREIVPRIHHPRVLDILTERGTLRVEVACPEAPLTCLNFVQLAAQGFYDGLTFHRVVPDFVVQAGDPRGDGLGGPGYSIRDEMNLLRYRRGTLGMALSGPHTGGSQFFITLSAQPHLDGGYTAFGRLVAGGEVLDRLVQGDRILSIVEPSG